MSEMEDKLQKLLSDPQSMAQAISMVSSIMGGQTTSGGASERPDSRAEFSGESADLPEADAANSEAAPQESGEIKPANLALDNIDMSGLIGKMLPQLMGSAVGSAGIDKNKMNLLMAVKPFCEEQHQKSIEHAINLVKIAKTAQTAMKGIPKGLFGGLH